MAAGDLYTLTGRTSPNKAAWKLIGGDVDDYVQVDAFTAARVAANDTKGTFSAWVMFDSLMLTRTQTIIGNGDANVVEFLDISVEAGLLTVRCTDATTVQFITQADASTFKPYTWYNIAVVQAADGHGVRMYVNGAEIAATNDTATDVNEWYANLDGMDSGLFGASNKSGDDSITQEFSGFITDIKYWNSALTAAQIKSNYEGDNTGFTPTTFWDSSDSFKPADLTYIGTLVGAVTIATDMNSFAAQLHFLPGLSVGVVVADDVSIGFENGRGHAVVIKAA